jgi:RecB family endonuclease NucS
VNGSRPREREQDLAQEHHAPPLAVCNRAGLVIIDGGREQTVTSGRIDITARDRNGSTVVIELKASVADRDAIGQILSYMGDLAEGSTQVRGIVIAKEFSPRAISAARAASNVRLVHYSFRFLFGVVSTSASEAAV